MDEEVGEDIGRWHGEPCAAAIDDLKQLAIAADQSRFSGWCCHD